MNIGLFILYFWLAYILVTLVGIAHTVFNWKVLKIANLKEKVTSMYDITAYAKTVPFHPLYNIVIWSLFAWLYLARAGSSGGWRAALILGAGWALITIVLDLFGWVIVKHPWRMTFKEMYVDYQPWITLIYLTIFLSPFLALVLV